MIFNINSTRGQNAGPHVRSTGNLSSLDNCLYFLTDYAVHACICSGSPYRDSCWCEHHVRYTNQLFIYFYRNWRFSRERPIAQISGVRSKFTNSTVTT